MYQAFCGLREPPFELTPNPKFLYFSPRHREALSILEYGLAAAKSLTVLLGDVGTGKTTLIKAALESERCRHVRCITISNPALRRDEFLTILAARPDGRAAFSWRSWPRPSRRPRTWASRIPAQQLAIRRIYPRAARLTIVPARN